MEQRLSMYGRTRSATYVFFYETRQKNRSSFYKKEKQRLLDIIDNLDIKAKTMPLDFSERERDVMRDANDQLANLRRDEDTKWAQRVKVKHIQ
jgi:hypothetical protein